MASLAMSPVADAIFALLQTSAMRTALSGRWHSDVPADPTFPFGWIEIFREVDERGFGTGDLPNVEVRLHAFSTKGSMNEAQDAIRLAIALVKDQALTIAGYTMAGHVFYRETVTLADEEIGGVKCHELVATFDLFAEAA